VFSEALAAEGAIVFAKAPASTDRRRDMPASPIWHRARVCKILDQEEVKPQPGQAHAKRSDVVAGEGHFERLRDEQLTLAQ